MPSPATSRQLAAGRWSTLPAAPINQRDGASVVWTGTELLVWGGASGAEDHLLHADGAGYDPASGIWESMPASPLSPRVGQAAVWTGSELVVWGGFVKGGANPSAPTADGAAYDPTTGRWEVLPPAPLSPRGDAIAVWTGAEVLVLGGGPGGGGQPGEVGGSDQAYGDGAAYDPSTDRWQHLPAPVAPQGHPLTWSAAVQLDGELLAWSEWEMQDAGGVDLFAYSEPTGAWRLVRPAAAALPDVEEVLAAGQEALVRGITYNCGGCPGPAVPEVVDLYNPVSNAWTRLPADPLTALDFGGLVSAWTGGALFSFNPEGEASSPTDPSQDVLPGDASAYDPATHAWQRLPAAPSGCDSPLPWDPVWTGRQLILYCEPSSGGGDGFVLTAGG
jgi:N-acetylneuraminic acid mutarotase